MLDTGNGLMQTDKQCGAPIDRNEGCDVIDVPIQVGAQLKHTMPCIQLLLRVLLKELESALGFVTGCPDDFHPMHFEFF